MTPKASRRFLFIALGLSLVVHALLLGWLRSPFALRQEQATTVTIVRARVARITQATPPPRTPAPRPTPKAHAVAPPRITANAGRSPAAVATAAPPTPAPTATPPAALASARPCRDPNAPAGLSATPDPGAIPVAARAAATNGTTAVLVHLNADGSIASAAVSASSGNGALDAVALAMAKSASYAPAYKDCKAVASDYTFAAKWAPW